MNRFQLSLLLLATLFSFSADAHQARVNREQRKAIRERLEKTGCLGPLTRGATRSAGHRHGELTPKSGGATRGASRSAEPALHLPEAAERYSNYFALVIPAEFDLPYGKKTDPKSHLFFRKDPYEGAEKIKVQKELGIRWNDEDAPTSTPNWIEFANNYRAALKVRGIDPAKTFVPAMVLYRNLGEEPGKSGKPVMKREYLFIDPLTEKFPRDMKSWNVLDKDVEFNIPFEPIYEAMQKGKFPLLDAVHDISHFVSFLRFPEFAQAVRSQVKKGPELTRAFKSREYWLTEALSLPDPNGMAENHKFLKDMKRPTRVRPIWEIEAELAKLEESALVDYSYRLAKHFESQLRDVSGGNSSAPEKWYYLSESFGMSALDLLTEDLTRTKPIQKAMEFGKIYFENAPVTLHANPKTLTNETATFSINTFITAQKLIALSLKNPSDPISHRKEALAQLVKFASRTESMLAIKPFTYQEWAEGFLTGDFSQTEPLAKMLTSVFNNDIVPNYYLGKGKLRPKKKLR